MNFKPDLITVVYYFVHFFLNTLNITNAEYSFNKQCIQI